MDDKIEDRCDSIRKGIEVLKGDVADLINHNDFRNEDQPLQGVNVPPTQQGNMRANITLAFRHLEDARMRIGKVMQAKQGGISILDK